MKDNLELQIKQEFLDDECSWIDTIEALQSLGYLPKQAEDLVEAWFEERKTK